MTVTVDININIDENTLSERVVVEDSALADVRFHFNPSALKEVVVLKALAAAFITAANEVGRNNKDAGREAAHSRTQAQDASMWAVAGATKRL